MSVSNNQIYQFGPFQFHLSQRLLKREGAVISLPPKATEILVLLLSNAGDLVEKEILMNHVWPDSFVEEGNLTQNIFTLRRALGDRQTQVRYIETVARRGYRFVADVSVLERLPSGNSGINPFFDIGNSHQSSPTLMVLPFVNATGDQKFEELADAITDNLINNLSKMSSLRVMSSTMGFRYKGKDIEHTLIAAQFRVTKMIAGKLTLRGTRLIIGAELLDPINSWTLFRNDFSFSLGDSLDSVSQIALEICAALKPTLISTREGQLTLRYTENSRAYLEYTKGRFQWSKLTREKVQKAIEHFGNAIVLDPNYSLAYSGIVDSYLRLTTGYLPPLVDDVRYTSPEFLGKSIEIEASTNFDTAETSASKVRLRFEWDWKNAERELKRANDLKAEDISGHQWQAAYLFVRQLCLQSQQYESQELSSIWPEYGTLPQQIRSAKLTSAEEIQVFCGIAREQIDLGNYSAACLILKSWWQPDSWPTVSNLDIRSSADLLFTAGELAGFVASTNQLPNGQKNAEALLSGAIVLFQQLGSFLRAREARIELALCYYRQGRFDLGRAALLEAMEGLGSKEPELRCLALVRLASLERHSGQLNDALEYLKQATELVESSGPWVSGRFHLELAATYKELATANGDPNLFERSIDFHLKSLREFEAIGNIRLLGIARNNLGFLLLTWGQYERAIPHLWTAWVVFERLGDKVRRAQVDDTLARLLIALREFELAKMVSERATDIFQNGDEDALFAEVLTTRGLVMCKLDQGRDAIITLERAYGIAARCGDREGALKALLIMLEELESQLSSEQQHDIGLRLRQLLPECRQSSIKDRALSALELVGMERPRL
jgi:DNA-binding winged helix-turn-helix (wHTH) protein/tetratricopeptide (TPR) repeat protein